NPFRNKTTISFNNPNNEVYTLCIFDLNGRKVSEIYDVRSNRIKFERGSLPEGVYFVELKGEKVYRGKMVVI
ncbi:MAG: T9SS type A sorting domain-containing protein, partial [Bacteroidales bacterium]|nr:T9SS type A sorting domain-containing protein [Bacteroidales bacterium]